MSDLGTVLKVSPILCFHCLLDSEEPSLRKATCTSPRFSPLQYSPGLEYLDRTTVLLPLSRSDRVGFNDPLKALEY